MIFHKPQKKIFPVSFSINCIPIENVKFFKFLGIILDENLSWKSHTNLVANKLSKVVGILNRLKVVYPEQALFFIYNSLFMSHINYGLLLWGTNMNKISLIQKKAIRIITRSNYRAHSEPLYKEFGLLNVNDLFHLKLLKFYYKLSYNLLPSYFDSYLEAINKELSYTYNLRPCARPLIRLPRTRLVSSETNVLYQLLTLINSRLHM